MIEHRWYLTVNLVENEENHCKYMIPLVVLEISIVPKRTHVVYMTTAANKENDPIICMFFFTFSSA